MCNQFQNRVVLITGASSGIGRALALRLAALGARVGLVARRQDLLAQLAAQIEAAAGRCAAFVADVGDLEQIRGAVQQVQAALGPIDYLIANAGVGVPTALNPLNTSDVELMVRVNLMGVIYAIEAVLPDMLARRSGHLIAVSSLAAFKGLPGESAYCATKSAVNAYLEGLRIQLREHAVAVTAVCPGFVKTPMTDAIKAPMPFMMTAERAAEYILYAIRKRKKVYRFPRPMSWLMTLTSWLPDWIVARALREHNETPSMEDRF